MCGSTVGLKKVRKVDCECAACTTLLVGSRHRPSVNGAKKRSIRLLHECYGRNQRWLSAVAELARKGLPHNCIELATGVLGGPACSVVLLTDSNVFGLAWRSTTSWSSGEVVWLGRILLANALRRCYTDDIGGLEGRFGFETKSLLRRVTPLPPALANGMRRSTSAMSTTRRRLARTWLAEGNDCD